MYINISSWFYQILSIYFQWPLMPVSKSSYYPVWEQFYFFPDRTLIKTKERCLSHIYIYVYLCYFLSLSLCLSPSLSLLASLIYVEVLIGLTPPLFLQEAWCSFLGQSNESLFSPRMVDSPHKCQSLKRKRESVR